MNENSEQLRLPFDDDKTKRPKRKLRTGKQRKDAALNKHEIKNAVSLRRARRTLLTLLLAGAESVKADDYHDAAQLAANSSKSCLGGVPGVLARLGIISCVGRANTKRRIANAREVKTWGLADRAAAEQWLADHPEIAPPSDAAAGGAR